MSNHYIHELAARFYKQAIDVAKVRPKARSSHIFPSQITASKITHQEASQIAKAMASVAPHSALDFTRVELHGGDLDKLHERAAVNPRNAPLQRWIYANEPRLKPQAHVPDAYVPASDQVWLPSGNPAIMTHELGHAIDFNGYPNNTTRMLLAGLYARAAPTLWKEHVAWNKGRHYFLEGAANHKLPADLVVRTLRDTERARRLGLSSYWGAGLGSLAGLGLGTAGAIAVDPRRPLMQLAPLGMLVGGALGTAAGLSIGKSMGSHKDLGSPEANQRYLDDYVQSYAKRYNISLDAADAAVQKIVRKKLKTNTGNSMRKAASSISPTATIGAHALVGTLAGTGVGAGAGALYHGLYGRKGQMLDDIGRGAGRGALAGGLGGLGMGIGAANDSVTGSRAGARVGLSLGGILGNLLIARDDDAEKAKKPRKQPRTQKKSAAFEFGYNVGSSLDEQLSKQAEGCTGPSCPRPNVTPAPAPAPTTAFDPAHARDVFRRYGRTTPQDDAALYQQALRLGTARPGQKLNNFQKALGQPYGNQRPGPPVPPAPPAAPAVPAPAPAPVPSPTTNTSNPVVNPGSQHPMLARG